MTFLFNFSAHLSCLHTILIYLCCFSFWKTDTAVMNAWGLCFSDDPILIKLQANSMGKNLQKFSKVHNYSCNEPCVQINFASAHSIAVFLLGSINVSCSLSWWMIKRLKCWFTSLSGWEDQPCKYSSHCSKEMNSIRSCPSNTPLAWGISHINF